MGVIDTIKQEADKLLNPRKYETELERKERHRREDMDHQLKLAKIKQTHYTEKTSGDSADFKDPFANEMGFLTRGTMMEDKEPKRKKKVKHK